MDNAKNSRFKVIFFIFIFIAFFILGALYLLNPKNQFSLKSKAAGANGIDLSFIGSGNVTTTAGTEYNLTIRKTSPQKLSTARIVIEYPAAIFNPTDIVINYQDPFTRSALAGDGPVAGANKVTIFAEGKRGVDGMLVDQSQTSIISVVKFKVKAGVINNASGIFKFTYAEPVGETSALTVEQHNPLTVSANSSGGSGISGASGISGSSGSSGVSGASGASGTSGISGTSGSSGASGASGPIPVSEDFALNLKLKFQGVLSKPGGGRDKMPVRVTAVSGGNKQEKTAEFSAGDNGIWTGSVTFTGMPIRSNYKILVKGPKHIQKKICDAKPTETYPGSYSCADGNINIVTGTNDLDFSGIYQLVGDLPEQVGVANSQNGFVNSYDTSLVVNNLYKTDAEAVQMADLNLDGAVNAMDYSLVISALSVRADEY